MEIHSSERSWHFGFRRQLQRSRGEGPGVQGPVSKSIDGEDAFRAADLYAQIREPHDPRSLSANPGIPAPLAVSDTHKHTRAKQPIRQMDLHRDQSEK